jgi:hypothetical protein
MSNPIDRLKAKAMQARGVATGAIRDLEADLDAIIAEEAVIAQKRAAAVAPHHEAIAGVKGELDGLKEAIDILSNGGPSLEEPHVTPKPEGSDYLLPAMTRK